MNYLEIQNISPQAMLNLLMQAFTIMTPKQIAMLTKIIEAESREALSELLTH